MDTNHGKAALLFPEPYEGEVEGIHGTRQVILAATSLALPPLLMRQGMWAISNEGVHCLSHNYSIAKDRVDETDWVKHMEAKTWVTAEVLSDFVWALETVKRLKEVGYI